MWEAPVRRRWARLAMIFVMTGLTFVYVLWRFNRTLPGFAWTPAAVAVVVLRVRDDSDALRGVEPCHPRSRHRPFAGSRAAYEPSPLRQEDNMPTVDVFVPTYSEGKRDPRGDDPRSVGARLSRGAGKGLDAGRRRPALVGRTVPPAGVGYLARPTHEHGKAGNLNYALPHTHGDFVLVVDADFCWIGVFLSHPGIFALPA